MAPATKRETAAIRRMRRTRMRSAATSGAGGHEAPLGQPAASSAWTSAALARPLTTTVGRHEALAQVASGQVHLGQQQPHVQVGSGLDLEGRLLAVVQEGGREAEAAPVLVHHLGGGARTGEEARVEVGQLGHQRPADDDARRAGLDGGAGAVERVLARRRRAARARSGACPSAPPAHGAGRPSPPRARQMPRDVTATTTARTTNEQRRR